MSHYSDDWQHHEAILNMREPAAITPDFVGACSDAMDWVLPDLMLIGPEAGDELRRMVYG